jgi:predicted RNase H-like HicB family nuclease
MEREYTAVIKKDGRWYTAWLEELPGVNTQGRSLKEVRENLREAAHMVLSANKKISRTASRGSDTVHEPFKISVVA